jgi:hypothetical protein
VGSVAFIETPGGRKKETTMDTGLKLEHVLRHLKNNEPLIEHWMQFGDVGRCADNQGVLANAGPLGRDPRHLIDGLTIAVHLLAKFCTALEARIAELERAKLGGNK